MGTREVYEEKLRTGNLHHDPTLNPGLGTPRCPRCLSPLDSHSAEGDWAITPVLHDATAVAGSGLGALLSAIYGFNSGMPYAQKYVKGPKWCQFMVGAHLIVGFPQLPAMILFTAGSAAFGGYALPRFTQLTVTSYFATSSASHYGISLLTRHVEEAHTSKPRQEKL